MALVTSTKLSYVEPG